MSELSEIDLGEGDKLETTYLVIKVTDTGPELSQQDVKEDFKYQTLKSIVKSMGGLFEVFSLFEGTAVTLYVPCCSGPTKV